VKISVKRRHHLSGRRLIPISLALGAAATRRRVLVVVFYLGAGGRQFLGAGGRAEQQRLSQRVDGGRNDQR